MQKVVIFLFLLLSLFCESQNVENPHVDLYYKENSDPNNQDFGDIACRLNTEKQTSFAGKYGTLKKNCDIPLVTLKETLDFITTYPNDTSKVVLFLGDIPGHDIKNQTKEYVLEVFKKTYELLIEYFGNSKIIIPVLGNHDAYPIEQFCRHDNPAFELCGKFMLDLYADMSSKWMPEHIVSQIRKYGYFSYVLEDIKLKFVSLHTQLVSIDNIFSWDYDFKTHEMRDWLEKELQDSQENGEKVIIVGHIPTDSDEPSPFTKLFPKWQNEILELIEHFQNIIVSSFYAHDHTDHWFLQRNEQGNPFHVNFVCPSVTTAVPNMRHGSHPYESMNPSVRLVKFERDNLQLFDILTFTNDLQKSNEEKSMKNNWFLEYSFRDNYKMKDLSPKSFDQLIQRMKTNEELFQNNYWLFHNSAIWPGRLCENECKIKQLCMLQNSHMQKFDMCLRS